jgi:hypothetical protein
MKLPACHSRRPVPSADDVFYCVHPHMTVPDQIVRPELCKVCELWKRPAPMEFRALPTPEGQYRHTIPCFHLGEQTGTRDCHGCGKSVRIKVFGCHHPEHSETTMQECLRCGDYYPQLRPGTIRTWAVGMTTAPRLQPTFSPNQSPRSPECTSSWTFPLETKSWGHFTIGISV